MLPKDAEKPWLFNLFISVYKQSFFLPVTARQNTKNGAKEIVHGVFERQSG